MIGIICIIVGIIAFSLWMWYEIKHPMDAEDEHEESVKFRERTIDKRRNNTLTEKT